MAFFKKKENTGYLDLGKRLQKQEEKIGRFQDTQSQSDDIVDTSQSDVGHQKSDVGSSGFFGGFFGGSAQASDVQTESEAEQKRKRLIKRVIELINRVEEQEKQIYDLKNRLEVIERKQKLGY